MIATLNTLFFPKKIKNYYLFSSSELSIYIKEQSIEASLFVLKGESKTLTRFWTLPYSKREDLLQHLQSLYKSISSSTAVKVVLDSSSCFFKKIDLPFHDYEKIRATLPFELESSLPLALSDIAFDFVVTHQSNDSSSILVAVIQKKILEEKLVPFTELAIPIDSVSIDTIEFYKITSCITTQKDEGTHIFIAIEENNTKILIFEGNKFLNVRIIVKKLHPEASLIDEVVFTIKTYCTEQSLNTKNMSITLFGTVPQPLRDSLNSTFTTECSLFVAEKFLEETAIINATNTQCTLIPYPCIPTSYSEEEFNINNQTISLKQSTIFQATIITGCILSLSIVGLLAFHIFSQINYLQQRLASDQNKIIAIMKKTFPSVEEELTRMGKKAGANKKNSPARQIAEALNLAHKDISQESSILSAFSAQSRNSFLEYLVTLSTKIDRETLGLELKKMSLNKNTITLEGRVRNFEALEQFEKALKETELFSTIPDMQKVDFVIPLPLVPKGGLS